MGTDIKESLVEKSQEAFLLALEIYNKPTIKYRVEGFSFFICNAWELLMKSKIISDDDGDLSSIYYKNKTNRTLSLEDSLKQIMSDNRNPVRINIEKLIEIRNESTHFIIEEYEIIYTPLFQAAVINYINYLNNWFGIDYTKNTNISFLCLLTNLEDVNYELIKDRYGEKIVNKFKQDSEDIKKLTTDIDDSEFAIKIDISLSLVNNPNKADVLFNISNNNQGEQVTVITKAKDPEVTHPYTFKSLLNSIKKEFTSLTINQWTLQQIFKKLKVTGNAEYCYHMKGTYAHKRYSEKLRKIIIDKLKNPNYLETLKNKKKR